MAKPKMLVEMRDLMYYKKNDLIKSLLKGKIL